MKLTGSLTRWNDERGFGFIAGDDGEDYFVHISDIARIATRPRDGDRLTFEPERGKDGRLRASAAKIAGANPRATRETFSRGLPVPAKSFEWRWLLSVLLSLALLWGIGNGRLWNGMAAAYLAVGALSFLSYYLDKRYAESGAWRIKEATLLGLDLCFGIIGGLAGQAAFRHKTRKPRYVTATILLAGVHLAWLTGIASGTMEPADVLALIGL